MRANTFWTCVSNRIEASNDRPKLRGVSLLKDVPKENILLNPVWFTFYLTSTCGIACLSIHILTIAASTPRFLLVPRILLTKRRPLFEIASFHRQLSKLSELPIVNLGTLYLFLESQHGTIVVISVQEVAK